MDLVVAALVVRSEGVSAVRTGSRLLADEPHGAIIGWWPKAQKRAGFLGDDVLSVPRAATRAIGLRDVVWGLTEGEPFGTRWS